MQKPSAPTVKKKYEPPVLTIYGTVAKLTQKVGVNGGRDSPRRFNNKTRV
jgi:hypothetical protein